MIRPGPATLAALAVAVLLLAWYLVWTVGRLDRLHGRVEGARAALDAQLAHRAAVALELAASGLLDPATSVLLVTAAHRARAAEGDARELAESDLSRALRAALSEPETLAALQADPPGAAVLAELDSTWRRVALARRFHNDAVRAARALRRARLVRYLRLAGRAPTPQTFEMDDAPPDGLAG
ncbi:MAG: hypothetical protein ACOYY2_13905 [Actinomycetota bacterium]